MVADFLTKSLALENFLRLRQKSGVIDCKQSEEECRKYIWTYTCA